MIDDTLDIKQKVINILQSVNMAESRASKLDIDDFLKYVFVKYQIQGKLSKQNCFIFIGYFMHLIRQTFISVNIFVNSSTLLYEYLIVNLEKK